MIPPAVVATNLPVERLVQRHVSPQLLGLLRVEPHAGRGTFNVSRRLDFARGVSARARVLNVSLVLKVYTPPHTRRLMFGVLALWPWFVRVLRRRPSRTPRA